ncbi:MAG: DHH family phosphoesterase [Candidatus Falkowbacteria bacterium]
MSIDGKKWKLKETKISDNLIKNNPDMSPVILQLLNNRGFSIDQIKQFLEPNYNEQLHDSFLFKDMKAVVDLIFKHIEQKNKIVIYGDYDADGVTATAVMFKTLEFLGCKKLDIYIPHRETEGYGMNKDAIKKITDDGVKLIITVDTGIRSKAEVDYAKELGMEIIVTDHHEAPDELPDCLIINSKIDNEKYPFKELAGVGVAFKLAQALLLTQKRDRMSPSLSKEGIGVVMKKEKRITLSNDKNDNSEIFAKTESFEKWLLDLVAIGTVADLVPLIDENRVLVKYGLVVLNKTKRLGLQKLIEVAQSGVDKNGDKREIDAWQIGFQLAPRLNAAGRLDYANTAYQLLVTEDENEATKIAQELDKTNKERQRLTEEIFEEADNALTPRPIPNSRDEGGQATLSQREGEQASIEEKKILFAISPKLRSPLPEGEGAGGEGVWPAGVMGLVSGKLTEKYYRPSLAITKKQDSIVGSGRSILEFDITEMLEECSEFLSAYGGHKQACGFTVKPSPLTPLPRGEGSNLEKFLEKAKEVAEIKLADVELIPTLNIDMEIDFKDVDEELYETLQKLRPFGMANAQPKFVTKNLKIVNTTNMGANKQHLKLRLQQNSVLFDAIAFSVPDEWKEIKIGDEVDLVYYIDINEWSGTKSVQLKIIDIKIN